MSGVLRLRAPAKLNLGLRLTGVRPDGYHLLESVFVPLALSDEIEIELRSGDHAIDLVVEAAADAGLPAALSDVPAGPGNLVYRAARALCDKHEAPGRVSIRLVKRIPAAAGLGGGSSDAATVLRGLAALVTAGAGRGPGRSCLDSEVLAELEALALGLGADVPYFLAPAPALVRGIGDRIEPLVGFPELDVVLVNPGVSLATAAVYRATDALGAALTPREPGSTMAAISRLCRNEAGDLGGALGDLLINDLEPAARQLCPAVGELCDRLRSEGALAAGMTGSGATVFGVFESGEHADRAAARLRRPGGHGGHDGHDREGGQGGQGASRGRGRQRATDAPWIVVTRTVGEPS